jgi:hypothetical protein
MACKGCAERREQIRLTIEEIKAAGYGGLIEKLNEYVVARFKPETHRPGSSNSSHEKRQKP